MSEFKVINVKGFGRLKFPDTMSDEEIREVLKQFEPKKDDTIPKALEAMNKLLKSLEKTIKDKKPVVVTVPEIKEIEKQVIVEKPVIQEVDKIIEKPVKQRAREWIFDLSRDELGRLTSVKATPNKLH